MLLVHRGFFVLVTIRAGEHGKVRRIHVAIVAGCPFALMRSGVDREGVVGERGAHPGHGRVAERAVGRESGSDVVGVGDRLVLALVARVAIRGRARIAPANVTTRAGRGGMRAGERKSRTAMIKARGCPGHRRVTDLTLLREARSLMVGIRSVGVFAEVTRNAGRT